jgi:hypothetical protein
MGKPVSVAARVPNGTENCPSNTRARLLPWLASNVLLTVAGVLAGFDRSMVQVKVLGPKAVTPDGRKRR